jgi:hypothetical protein
MDLFGVNDCEALLVLVMGCPIFTKSTTNLVLIHISIGNG